jgi:hypothetical protein
MTGHVRYWPIADIPSCTAHVRFWSDSGHWQSVRNVLQRCGPFSRCVNQPHWPKVQHRARPVHASNVGWHDSGNDAVWILSKDGLDLRLTTVMGHWKRLFSWRWSR